MDDGAKFPEAGPGVDATTRAALWILGRMHKGEGNERAAKLALGLIAVHPATRAAE